MSISLQNLRSVTPGVVPSALAPGQLCFNLADEIMFVGDGSNVQTSFDGTQVPGTPGQGWFSIPLASSTLGQYFLSNPAAFGNIPADGDTLVYSAAAGRPVWVSDGGAASVYTTSNSAVSAAPGTTTSEKITNALGVTPINGDSAIVSGVPGDQYQGLYLFTSGVWTFAAGYAPPTANQVPYNNAGSGLSAVTVQNALTELGTGKLPNASNVPATGYVLTWGGSAPLWVPEATVYPTAAEVSFNNSGTGIPYTNVQQAIQYVSDKTTEALAEANSAQNDATAAQVTANLALSNSATAINDAASALAVANAALPKSGGTMTGNIVFNDGQSVDAGTY